MIQGTLTFISRVKDDRVEPLRTPAVIGFCDEPPTVGDHFTLFAEPLDKEQNIRFVRTSPITSVDGDIFITNNSIYRWRPL